MSEPDADAGSPGVATNFGPQDVPHPAPMPGGNWADHEPSDSAPLVLPRRRRYWVGMIVGAALVLPFPLFAPQGAGQADVIIRLLWLGGLLACVGLVWGFKQAGLWLLIPSAVTRVLGLAVFHNPDGRITRHFRPMRHDK